MADPRPRREFNGVIFEQQPDGSFTRITPLAKPTSIADGKISDFNAPKVPVSIPAREKILAEPESLDVSQPTVQLPLLLSTGGQFEVDAPNVLTPEGRTRAIQDAMGLGASAIPGGGFFANLAKSAIGTMGGNIVGQALEGKPELDLGETTKEGLTDIAINTVLGSIPFVGTKVKQAAQPFIQNVKKRGLQEAMARALAAFPVIRPEMQAGQYIDPLRERNVAPGLTTRESITAGKGIPMSVGSATGSKVLQFMESLLAPDAAKVLQQEGTQANVKQISKLMAPGTLGERGKAGLKRLETVKQGFTDAEKLAYSEVSDIAKQNVRTIKSPGTPVTKTTQTMYGPKTETVVPVNETKIAGPIFLADSVAMAQEALPEIRSAMKNIQTPTLMGDLEFIESNLSAFSKGRIIPYEDVRKLQANLNKLAYEDGAEILPSNATRILKNLKAKLDADVFSSMEAHWKTGKPVEAYRKALGVTSLKYDVITKRLAKSYRKGLETPEQFYDEAFKSATSAREFANVVGARNAGAEFLTRQRDKHFNPAVGVFDAQNALADWGRPETREIAKTVLTSTQRAAYEQFLKRQAAISGDPSNIGVLALGTQQANAAIGTARDLAKMPGNPSNLFSVSAGRIGAIIGLRKFTNEVLLNPARAREASRLLSVNPVRQPKAHIDAQRFILGSKLGTILLRAENGEEVQYNTETGEATKLQ